MNRLLKISAALLGAMILALSSAPAFAEDGGSSTGSGDSTTTGQTTTTENRQAAENAAKVKEQEHQQEVKDKVCKAKKDGAENVENRVVNRGQKRLDAFTKIAERAEKFKTDKNLTVTNYDSLVADVNAKKATAQAAVDTLNADKGQLPAVACGNATGKPAIEKFKTDLKAEQTALKAYKTSIKTLIQAIKTAAKSTSTEGSQQ
jgi:hypothetical protein